MPISKELQEKINVEKENIFTQLKKAIRDNDEALITNLLAKKYEVKDYGDSVSGASYDLGERSASKELVTSSYPYIDINVEGRELIEYAANHGSLAVVKKLRELGAFPVAATLEKYKPTEPNQAVTEYLFTEVINSHIENGKSSDMLRIFELLQPNASADLYNNIFAAAKKRAYETSNAEQLKALKNVFGYDAAYVRENGIPSSAPSDKMRLLKDWNGVRATVTAEDLNQTYRNKNLLLLEGIKKITDSVGGFFTAASREAIMKAAMGKARKINATDSLNEAEKFEEVLAIITESYNSIQHELNDSFRASLGIERESTTQAQLYKLIESVNNLNNPYFRIKTDENKKIIIVDGEKVEKDIATIKRSTNPTRRA